jgi:DNA replication and repair protein RecF
MFKCIPVCATSLRAPGLILQELSLFQFRNLDRVEWQPHPRANLILGANAQGKTNLLEAIFFLGTTKTLRPGAAPEDLIMHEQSEALVRGKVSHQDGQITRDLEAQLKAGSPKRFLLNFKKLSPLSKIFGQLPVVLFTPDDLELVKTGPAARRLYLDLEISQASAPYLADLTRYQRALKQRNGALKLYSEGRGSLDTVHAFDDELVKSGSAVLRFRRDAVAELGPLVAEVQQRLAGKAEALGLRYISTVALDGQVPKDDAEISHQFLLRLRERAREEQARGSTLTGPHRDDLELLLDGRPARLFASQGQQRSIALSLKLAEVQFLSSKLGESPVLLLDDVLSELDLERQKHLLSLLDERVQTFVSSTHAADLAYKPGQVLSVEAGKLLQQK